MPPIEVRHDREILIKAVEVAIEFMELPHSGRLLVLEKLQNEYQRVTGVRYLTVKPVALEAADYK